MLGWEKEYKFQDCSLHQYPLEELNGYISEWEDLALSVLRPVEVPVCMDYYWQCFASVHVSLVDLLPVLL